MIYPRFFSTSFKLLSASVFLLVLSGCGSSNSNRMIRVEDSSAGLVEFAIEKQIIPKLVINARYSQLKAEDSLPLQTNTFYDGSVSRDYLLIDNNYKWQGPSSVDQRWQTPNTVDIALEVKELSFDVMFVAMDNDVLKIELGGGIASHQKTFTASPNPTASTQFSKTPLFIKSNFSVKPTHNTLITLGLNHLGSDLGYSQALSVSWLPIPLLQLTVGHFWYRTEAEDNEELNVRLNSEWVIPPPEQETNPLDAAIACAFFGWSCDANNTPTQTVSKDASLTSPVGMRASGLKGAITLRF